MGANNRNSTYQINSNNYLNTSNDKINKLKKDNKIRSTSDEKKNLKGIHLRKNPNEYYHAHNDKNKQSISLEEKYEIAKKKISELTNELEIMRKDEELNFAS